ncbi:hypothetical protein C8F01DRAFT_464922 [Mycena amicta]|nr:hypothetical protein C8F01DRAFT_464922 [Mycena amicta]
MPPFLITLQFNKTVSALNRGELVQALTLWDLDTDGAVKVLRNRLNEHLRRNQHLMDNPGFRPLFTRDQRRAYDAQHGPQGLAWGGVGQEAGQGPPESSRESTPDAVPSPPHTPGPELQDFDDVPVASDDEAAAIQLLKRFGGGSLTGFVGNIIQSGGNGNANTTNATASTSSARKRPVRIPGLTVSNARLLPPDAIRKRFSASGGWQTHVPLHLLTDKACLLAMQDSSGKLLNDMYMVDSSTGNTVAVSRDFPIGPELVLTYDEWDQAWRCLLDLIAEFLPDELEAWKTHYTTITNRPNRSNLWSVYLEYDSRIRRSALSSPVDPTYFQFELWNELEAEHYGKQAAAAALRFTQDALKSQGSSGGKRGGDSDSSGGHRFRPTDGARNKGDKFRCFVCGSDEPTHRARTCAASALVNGRPLILSVRGPNGSGSRKDSADKAYCFPFNGRGCSRGSSCTHGNHWCSLCGDQSGNHSAQSCRSL